MRDLKKKALIVYEAMFNDKETVTIGEERYYFDTTPQLRFKLLTRGDYKFLEQTRIRIQLGGRKPGKITILCGYLKIATI